ncbi:hypothetical protein HK104_002192 [Borealophlyctis nickersoniae]|nr:hypothetical protein HK104_002192 [Borealophlyctis nickersoniae]
MLSARSDQESVGSSHPKIDCTSKDDILYLKSELQKAAHAAIARRIEKSGRARREMDERTEKWVSRIFNLAAPNILINGMSYEKAFEIVQEYEPKDEALQQKVADLTEKVNATLVEVVKSRKDFQAHLAKLAKDRVTRETSIAETTAFIDGSAANEVIGADVKASAFNFGGLENQYQQTSAMLPKLETTISSTVGKLERAQTVITGLVESQMAEEGGGGSEGGHGASDAHDDPMLDMVTPRRARSGLLQKLQ